MLTERLARVVGVLEGLVTPTPGELALLGILRRLDAGEPAVVGATGANPGADPGANSDAVALRTALAAGDTSWIVYLSSWGPEGGSPGRRPAEEIGQIFSGLLPVEPAAPSISDAPAQLGADWNAADFVVADPPEFFDDPFFYDTNGLGWWVEAQLRILNSVAPAPVTSSGVRVIDGDRTVRPEVRAPGRLPRSTRARRH